MISMCGARPPPRTSPHATPWLGGARDGASSLRAERRAPIRSLDEAHHNSHYRPEPGKLLWPGFIAAAFCGGGVRQ
jgi:hypothetical protein